jgi:hypothetical protein
MLQTNKNYRKDYTGEKIVTERKSEGRVWNDTYEYIPNSVINNQISNRAVAIGNGSSRLKFPLQYLKNPAGLLGADTVQTYGCNALYRDFTPDFLVASGNDIVKEIARSRYINTNIVYTRSMHLLEYPNKFYLIPYDPYADAGTTAIYLAAFDGHKKIYMLGFDGQTNPKSNDNVYAGTNGYDAKIADITGNKWVQHRKVIFNTYDDVDFVWVTESGRSPVPAILKSSTNFRQISHRDFVLECSI